MEEEMNPSICYENFKAEYNKVKDTPITPIFDTDFSKHLKHFLEALPVVQIDNEVKLREVTKEQRKMLWEMIECCALRGVFYPTNSYYLESSQFPEIAAYFSNTKKIEVFSDVMNIEAPPIGEDYTKYIKEVSKALGSDFGMRVAQKKYIESQNEDYQVLNTVLEIGRGHNVTENFEKLLCEETFVLANQVWLSRMDDKNIETAVIKFIIQEFEKGKENKPITQKEEILVDNFLRGFTYSNWVKVKVISEYIFNCDTFPEFWKFFIASAALHTSTHYKMIERVKELYENAKTLKSFFAVILVERYLTLQTPRVVDEKHTFTLLKRHFTEDDFANFLVRPLYLMKTSRGMNKILDTRMTEFSAFAKIVLNDPNCKTVGTLFVLFDTVIQFHSGPEQLSVDIKNIYYNVIKRMIDTNNTLTKSVIYLYSQGQTMFSCSLWYLVETVLDKMKNVDIDKQKTSFSIPPLPFNIAANNLLQESLHKTKDITEKEMIKFLWNFLWGNAPRVRFFEKTVEKVYALKGNWFFKIVSNGNKDDFANSKTTFDLAKKHKDNNFTLDQLLVCLPITYFLNVNKWDLNTMNKEHLDFSKECVINAFKLIALYASGNEKITNSEDSLDFGIRKVNRLFFFVGRTIQFLSENILREIAKTLPDTGKLLLAFLALKKVRESIENQNKTKLSHKAVVSLLIECLRRIKTIENNDLVIYDGCLQEVLKNPKEEICALFLERLYLTKTTLPFLEVCFENRILIDPSTTTFLGYEIKEHSQKYISHIIKSIIQTKITQEALKVNYERVVGLFCFLYDEIDISMVLYDGVTIATVLDAILYLQENNVNVKGVERVFERVFSENVRLEAYDDIGKAFSSCDKGVLEDVFNKHNKESGSLREILNMTIVADLLGLTTKARVVTSVDATEKAKFFMYSFKNSMNALTLISSFFEFLKKTELNNEMIVCSYIIPLILCVGQSAYNENKERLSHYLLKGQITADVSSLVKDLNDNGWITDKTAEELALKALLLGGTPSALSKPKVINTLRPNNITPNWYNEPTKVETSKFDCIKFNKVVSEQLKGNMEEVENTFFLSFNDICFDKIFNEAMKRRLPQSGTNDKLNKPPLSQQRVDELTQKLRMEKVANVIPSDSDTSMEKTEIEQLVEVLGCDNVITQLVHDYAIYSNNNDNRRVTGVIAVIKEYGAIQLERGNGDVSDQCNLILDQVKPPTTCPQQVTQPQSTPQQQVERRVVYVPSMGDIELPIGINYETLVQIPQQFWAEQILQYYEEHPEERRRTGRVEQLASENNRTKRVRLPMLEPVFLFLNKQKGHDRPSPSLIELSAADKTINVVNFVENIGSSTTEEVRKYCMVALMDFVKSDPSKMFLKNVIVLVVEEFITKAITKQSETKVNAFVGILYCLLEKYDHPPQQVKDMISKCVQLIVKSNFGVGTKRNAIDKLLNFGSIYVDFNDKTVVKMVMESIGEKVRYGVLDCINFAMSEVTRTICEDIVFEYTKQFEGEMDRTSKENFFNFLNVINLTQNTVKSVQPNRTGNTFVPYFADLGRTQLASPLFGGNLPMGMFVPQNPHLMNDHRIPQFGMLNDHENGVAEYFIGNEGLPPRFQERIDGYNDEENGMDQDQYFAREEEGLIQGNEFENQEEEVNEQNNEENDEEGEKDVSNEIPLVKEKKEKMETSQSAQKEKKMDEIETINYTTLISRIIETRETIDLKIALKLVQKELTNNTQNPNKKIIELLRTIRSYIDFLYIIDANVFERGLHFLESQRFCYPFEKKMDELYKSIKSRNGNKRLTVTVKRQQVLQTLYAQLRNSVLFDCLIKVRFENETGEDVGGLLRECYALALEDIVDEKTLLFRVENGVLEPDLMSSPELMMFVGKLIGKMICDNMTLNLRFSLTFLRMLLGKRTEVEDLKVVDPEFYKQMQNVLNSDVSAWGLTFVYDEKRGDKVEEVKLKEGDLEVNESNKKEYIELLVQYKYNTKYAKQVEWFGKGLFSVLAVDKVKMFEEKELEKVFCGEEFDVKELKKNCVYESYNEESLQVVWFWSVLEEMNQLLRNKVLQFVTGSPNSPIGGFQKLVDADGHPLPFMICSIKYDNPDEKLPTAHTCINRLDLPNYSNKEILKEKLLYAISECTGFGFY
ncbi:ubiquitin protein ligase, putative [Entamoeba invadens IP1]|uniref:HECT-type E3 ubiquitin transferase n=1 Tax=Entamoeba invadens IP1 TaxID=370355 RepID=A0A0A1UCZ1_ENTIV|nr:ubiquitin protein ligase, putative [Entamoeba invadens IP1]ELP90164.1 ubiquitin protein ligase, putative [Entamoeba invadens IP1]|eukprot:XP_004256935.1 ubiquitin protein ligase, putative [Entamoeba invadens IP1]